MEKQNDKTHHLKSSKRFCMLPWMHMHILPSSNVVPCCVWPYDKPLGNLANDSLSTIWNNAAYKDLRMKMLNDEYVENCNQCYERETGGGSLRLGSNASWAYLYDRLVKPSLENGELKELHMAYFDVRFSNICNFKCRGCSPELSSAWLGDHEKLYNYKSDRDKLISIMPNPNAWSELVRFLPAVEVAYFAGGEPLIMDEHYLILEELIKLGKTKTRLSYNTNMSNLKFRNKEVTEYWNQFEHVSVGVSIDDIGARGEYFRSGSNWNKIIENIMTVQKKCPHVIFSINCTVSMFNVYYLPEIHKEAFDLGIIRLGDFFSNLLIDPHEYRVHVIPLEARKKIAQKLTSYMKVINLGHMETDPMGVMKLNFAFQSVVKFLLEGEEKSTLELFRKLNDRLDEIRNEDFAKVYPELVSLLDSPSGTV